VTVANAAVTAPQKSTQIEQERAMSHWLELRGITRSFGSIHALKGVDLTVDPGEVIGLIGENGAGKSTLMKIMSGFDDGFEGELLVDGKQVKLGTPKAARALGIAIAQQELSLVPTLTVAENIFLGGDHGPQLASLRKLAQLAMPFLDEVGLSDMSPTTPVSRLSVGERHLVEVARLIAHKPRLLILDEPTAALGQSDSDRIMDMVSRLKQQGKSVVYVSHRLDEIFRITDRCTVLRDGKSQASVATAELDTQKLVALMLGRELENMFPARPKMPASRAIYRVRELWPDQVLAPVDFEIRAGEILGLAGQLGSGAGEILAAIAGAGRVRSGRITDVVSGRSFLPGSPRQAIAEGIAYCSPDRKHDGLFLGRPIRENLSAPNLKRVSKAGFIQSAHENQFVTQLAKSFTVDVTRLDEDAAVLSGGNQQKVALGKWLSISPKVILVNEPTRGVDVGARAEIYLKIRALVDEGAAVVVASTDLLEITNLPDRVITFYKGAVSAELVGPAITSASILENITNPKHLTLSMEESV
jgi:ribose transport system ATP-binding protein